ncbi:MAG: hypothetical protein PVH62_00850 [Anaerolineae bacterium]|jgi:hypothetical protein
MDIRQQLLELLSEWLAESRAMAGFERGLCAGCAGALILSFGAFMVRIWWGKVTAPYRPQKVTLTTAKTPAQVQRDSCLWLLIALLGCLVLTIVFPEAPGEVWQVLLNVLFG